MKEEFTPTNFLVLPFLPLPMPTSKSVHVWPHLDNEVSTWFPKLNKIERACESLLLFIDFRLQTLLICKKEKHNMWEVVGRKCSAKQLFSNIHKIYREISLSNTVKCVQTVRLVTLLKRDPHPGVSESVVCRSATK